VRFWPREADPQFIFYVGHSTSFEDWAEGKKDFKGCIYQRYENRASYKKYKFQEVPSDEHSLLKYKMDKKDNSSSKSSHLSIDSTSKIVTDSSLHLDESYQEFQRTINDKLINMENNIDDKIVDLKKEMKNFFEEFMKKLDEKIENKKE